MELTVGDKQASDSSMSAASTCAGLLQTSLEYLGTVHFIGRAVVINLLIGLLDISNEPLLDCCKAALGHSPRVLCCGSK
jgi:hypothetical protein